MGKQRHDLALDAFEPRRREQLRHEFAPGDRPLVGKQMLVGARVVVVQMAIDDAGEQPVENLGVPIRRLPPAFVGFVNRALREAPPVLGNVGVTGVEARAQMFGTELFVQKDHVVNAVAGTKDVFQTDRDVEFLGERHTASRCCAAMYPE